MECVLARDMKQALLALALLANSCGSADEVATTNEGSIGISAEPVSTIRRGANLFVVTVRTVEPITTVDATVWMPSMGHGAPSDPRVVTEQPTKFRLEDVVFTMPGTWELRVQVSSAHGKGERVFRYEVP